MNPPVTLAWHGSACVLGIALAGLAPALTVADTHKRAQDWQFMARLYGWFPSVSGDLNHALPGGQDSATVDAGDILDALQGVFMGSFLARKGKWSLLTDLIYLDLSNGKNSTISILGDSGLGVDVDADLKLTGWVWNLAGGYTLYSANRANVDVLLGVRMLSIDTETKLTVDGPLPPILPSAKLSKSETLWDGIVGVKGRIALTDTWYSPYYLDVGTGDSSLTWQVMAGVGYAFDWGDLTLTYRHLSYDQSGDKLIQNLSFSGPAMGMNFRF